MVSNQIETFVLVFKKVQHKINCIWLQGLGDRKRGKKREQEIGEGRKLCENRLMIDELHANVHEIEEKYREREGNLTDVAYEWQLDLNRQWKISNSLFAREKKTLRPGSSRMEKRAQEGRESRKRHWNPNTQNTSHIPMRWAVLASIQREKEAKWRGRREKAKHGLFIQAEHPS